jgi:hypothetical protein
MSIDWVIGKEIKVSTNNPICQKCGLEMEVAGIGWLAVYMAYDPPTPYEARRGDLCACRECKTAVVTKFADGRPMGHFMGEPFEQEIASALRTGKLVLVWEHYQDSAKVPEPHKYLLDWLAERQAAREEGRP